MFISSCTFQLFRHVIFIRPSNSLFNVVIQLPVADLMLVLDALSYPLSCAIMARSSLAYGNCITVTFGIDGKASTPDSGYITINAAVNKIDRGSAFGRRLERLLPCALD
jgi:hypothetical protein